MARPVIRDNRGMTLIEVLIAFVLVTITAAALLKTTLLAMNTNVVNEMRDEASSVAEQQMSALRNTPFASLSTMPEPTITRSIRGVTCQYSPQVTVIKINDNSKQVSLTVTWYYKSQQYQHSIATILRQ